MQERSSLHILLYISILLNIVLVGTVYYFYHYKINSLTPLSQNQNTEQDLPLQKYSYKELQKRQFTPGEIEFGPIQHEATEEEPYTTHLFYYQTEGKRMSGIAHFPAEEGTYPVLVMLRGYVDISMYEPGVGSNPAARYFAEHGYITLAPDHLGYAESDLPPPEPFADRLVTYANVLQLIANIQHLNSSFENSNISIQADQDKIGIWAHSNGGQIALSVLEASGKEYPTVLWAPVSKPFPYSVLYFTDEYEDEGRYLRNLISQFEELYDIESFSLTNYLDWIKAPIQIHQGALDDAVPLKWSDQLNNVLVENNVDVEYITYPDADHNLRPDWDTAVERSLIFFDSYLKEN
ncbi:MAG TPA: prolyl oligopeptidase family serine peptidase [Candidatus Woesebacteria bacterium]|nr:prolyl oligopeptidase family serine peptidase [Candidatus Woesebacteria bacterium]